MRWSQGEIEALARAVAEVWATWVTRCVLFAIIAGFLMGLVGLMGFAIGWGLQ